MIAASATAAAVATAAMNDGRAWTTIAAGLGRCHLHTKDRMFHAGQTAQLPGLLYEFRSVITVARMREMASLHAKIPNQ